MMVHSLRKYFSTVKRSGLSSDFLHKVLLAANQLLTVVFLAAEHLCKRLRGGNLFSALHVPSRRSARAHTHTLDRDFQSEIAGPAGEQLIR